MIVAKPRPDYFILQAFDDELWCSVLETRFEVPDLQVLRTVLGPQANDDSELRGFYDLDLAERAALSTAFGVELVPAVIEANRWSVGLSRMHSIRTPPYLIHTGFELFLLLEGRKKLARMGDAYPPMQFDGEDRFNHWVEEGVLHREEVVEPFDDPRKKWHGHRTVYYTLKGEEWRIPAMKLIWEAAKKSGGWNEYFERLEGMLFGYEDWQNDWWIERGIKGGGFGGARLCCAVTEAGLAWMEMAGFRALPPVEGPALAIAHYDASDDAAMCDFMCKETDSVALVSFAVSGRVLPDLVDISSGPPWFLPGGKVAELNRNLRRGVRVVMRREITDAV
jgi:hypothetical protein